MAGNLYQKRSSGRNFGKGINNEINVTPFVDVMLVLLIIFMVTSPMLVSGIVTELPQADTKPLQGNDEPVTVEVDGSGTIYIQEKPVAAEKLQPLLLAITKENRDARIFIRGHKGADYGQVIAVISLVNAAGFSKVALITQPVSSTQTAGAS